MIYTITIISLIFAGLGVLLYPLMIGKEKTGVYDYSGFIARIIDFIWILAIAGRIFGWW